MNTWVANSYSFYPSDEMPLVWVNLTMGGFVLVHSAYINGTKYNNVRYLTDICAASLFCASLITVLLNIYVTDNATTIAVAADLFSSAIFGGIGQLSIIVSWQYLRRKLSPSGSVQ